MLRIIETFSGIGSQAQALKNIGVPHTVEAIVEWEIGAMYAYDIMHNGPQDISPFRHHTRDSLIAELEKYNLSGDGKAALTARSLFSMSVPQLKAILCAIERNNNLVDITSVKASELPDTDILTYSFPCQDLSVSGHWHNNSGGIDRDANNRSTLLWQIERLLKEFKEIGKELPKFLLMENVSNILSSKHIGNFNEWKTFLEEMGYVNQVYTLDARNFGVPQSRIRTYMISVLVPNEKVASKVRNYFFVNNLENKKLAKDKINPISDYLRLNYLNQTYRSEAIESTPIFTPSRKKIYENNVILASGVKAYNDLYARTVTTKQDRHPNSGIIEYADEILTKNNVNYRNLTPRECFLLMGFEEKQFDLLLSNNIDVALDRKILPPSKLIKLAGNSIVVQVLESIFKQIVEINSEILELEVIEDLIKRLYTKSC
ncbi:TPA: DNA (cytosine-5-)-methyltransferase [Listeria monocytogenes]|nr:DNA (cytosine-5-)-methyltransferase [Listeria monocytogenes]HDI4828562.1 DNA (cytosine-5-)-methyltransferase [Listeria monocytogenes]HDM9928143.1 DNA (cytosine-5-)-methyltransferase [Listeria monocytogenes]